MPRFGIPAILGELMVGVVAGPGCLNLLHMRLFSGTPATDAFMLLAQIGGFVLMFIAGLETDIERMREAGPTAFIVALLGVVWPFFLGAGAAHLLGMSWNSAWFLGGALTATSVSISARTLMDAGKMTSPEASVILGAAVIDDVMGLFVLAFLQQPVTPRARLRSALRHNLACGSGKSPCSRTSSRRAADGPYLPLRDGVLYHRLPRGQKSDRPSDPALRKIEATEAVTSCVLALVLLYAVSAEWLGSVAGITGADLLGYVCAEAKLKTLIQRTFAAIGHGLLVPLFFVSIGLSSNVRAWEALAVDGRRLRHCGGHQGPRLRYGGPGHGDGARAQPPNRLRDDLSRVRSGSSLRQWAQAQASSIRRRSLLWWLWFC